METIDVVLLTESRYLHPVPGDPYIDNIFLEDRILSDALVSYGLRSLRVSWDDPEFNWSNAGMVLFRTPWDYFYRYAEFSQWLQQTAALTKLMNTPELIQWNIDKRYLRDLEQQGIRIPPTLFIDKGDQQELHEVFLTAGWKEGIIKPAVGGAARHTYRFKTETIHEIAEIYRQLIREEAMLVQQYQPSITERGEVAFMVMNGQFTHAVLKRAKPGDFRVQDDFGGTLHDYSPTREEIELAEATVNRCPEFPLYARIDVMWDSEGRPCVSELEVIEPELWFRRAPGAAKVLAEGIHQRFAR